MKIMPVRIGLFSDACAIYKRIGIPLLKYYGTQLIPVEQSFGGEVGVFYFVPFIATFLNISTLDAVWCFLFFQVVIGVIVSGSALLITAKTWIGKGVVCIGISALGLVAWCISDVYLTYFFTISFFPWILVLLERKYYRMLFCYSFLLGLIVEYGNLVRSFSGLPLLIGAIVAVMCFNKFSRKTVVLFIPLLLGMSLVKIHICTVIKQRDNYLKRQGYTFEKDTLRHTFWHNLYMGFGFITNNKKLYFDDGCSVEKVKQLDPQVGYLKTEYEVLLRNEVVKLCVYSPHYVLRVMFAKVGVIFYYLLLFANIGLIAAYCVPKPLYIEASYGVLLLVSALPGLLTIPNMLYLLGFISVATLYGIHSIVCVLNKRVL